MSELTKESIVSTKYITYIAIFVSLIAVCSFISIPLQIPITMQSFAIMLCGSLLGKKRGTIAVLIYILLGVIGLPVFAGFSSGIAVISGPPGGYIIGFIFMSFIIGLIIEKLGNKTYILALAMFSGLIVCYIFGSLWFLFIYTKGNSNLLTCLSLCVFPFIIPDIAKIILATFITNRLSKNSFFRSLSLFK